jgi:hypothetical protein
VEVYVREWLCKNSFSLESTLKFLRHVFLRLVGRVLLKEQFSGAA